MNGWAGKGVLIAANNLRGWLRRSIHDVYPVLESRASACAVFSPIVPIVCRVEPVNWLVFASGEFLLWKAPFCGRALCVRAPVLQEELAEGKMLHFRFWIIFTAE